LWLIFGIEPGKFIRRESGWAPYTTSEVLFNLEGDCEGNFLDVSQINNMKKVEEIYKGSYHQKELP
jgi:hypothetical protein